MIIVNRLENKWQNVSYDELETQEDAIEFIKSLTLSVVEANSMYEMHNIAELVGYLLEYDRINSGKLFICDGGKDQMHEALRQLHATIEIVKHFSDTPDLKIKNLGNSNQSVETGCYEIEVYNFVQSCEQYFYCKHNEVKCSLPKPIVKDLKKKFDSLANGHKQIVT